MQAINGYGNKINELTEEDKKMVNKIDEISKQLFNNKKGG